MMREDQKFAARVGNRNRIGWISCLVLVCGWNVSAEDQRLWTDPRLAASADADFLIQGEYLFEKKDATYGAQVVAQGGGKFSIYFLTGGLPGAGWKPGMERIVFEGTMFDGKVECVAADKELRVSISRDGAMFTYGEGNFTMKRVERTSPTLAAKPPQSAVVLFDGITAEQWEKGQMQDGLLTATGATSKKLFGSYKLHLEFRTPYKPFARSQKRGNSGIYHSGRWETQILDSFGLEVQQNECGGIYSIAKPRLNMCFPPLAWQTYDVDFQAATFNAEGKRTAWPKITVRLNGVLIHENVELNKDFTQSAPLSVPLTSPLGPVHLQDHQNPVMFRNIWIVPS